MYAVVLISWCLLQAIGASPIVSEEAGSIILCEQDDINSEIICKQSNETTSKEEITNNTMPLCDLLLVLRGNFTDCVISINSLEELANTTSTYAQNETFEVPDILFIDDSSEDQNDTKADISGVDFTTEPNIEELSTGTEDYDNNTLDSLTLPLELPVNNNEENNPVLEKAAIGDTIDDEDYYDSPEETEIDKVVYDGENTTKEENRTLSEGTESLVGEENGNSTNTEGIPNLASAEDNLARDDKNDTKDQNLDSEITTNDAELNNTKSEEPEEVEHSESSKVEETIPKEVTTSRDIEELSMPTESNNESTNNSWFWDWLFISMAPQESRVKRDENSYIPSGSSDDVNDLKKSTGYTNTNTTGELIGGSELKPLTNAESELSSSFQRNSSEENNFIEDGNETITECVDGCDVDLDINETEIHKLEQAVSDNYTKLYELDYNSTVPVISFISISEMKINDSLGELELDVIMPENTSLSQTIVHFRLQYGTIDPPINKAMLLVSVLNKLSDMEIEEDKTTFDSIGEIESNRTFDNTENMFYEEEFVIGENDTYLYGIISSDTFPTFELSNQTVENI